ncbi:tetratricopeptide repeat protein [Nitrosomonas sp. wSCUT-2]
MQSPKDIAQFLEEYWHKKIGLISTEIFSICAVFFLLISANAEFIWWISIPVISFVVWFIWFYTTKPPVVPKNKIGFLVCITCSDEKELKAITEDFIIPLRQLIKTGISGNSFHFIEIPQRLANQVIDVDSALEMRIRCKAHFMIYGRVRRKFINKQENHIIELEGAVAHQPVSDEVRENLTAEFSELLPRNVHIPTENDLFAFQFTSEWAEIVARYIIGVASAYSGDISYAERLFQDVQLGLKSKDQNFPIYRKLKERIPYRLAELYEAMASTCFSKWSETRDPDYLTEVDEWLDKIDEVIKDSKSVLFLRAITTFLTTRSVEEAIAMLRRVNESNNQIWQCNMAFLYAYKGDLKKAIQHYRYADRCDHQQEKLFQIEDFIHWLIEQEPAKYQLYYCLGFINMKIKGDQILAVKNFKKFLEMCDESEYIKEKELAQNWVSELLI